MVIYIDGDAIIDPTIGIHDTGDPVTTDENGNWWMMVIYTSRET